MHAKDRTQPVSSRALGLAVVIALHVLAVGLFLGHQVAPRVPRATEPLVVSIITPPRLAEAPPLPKPAPAPAKIVARAVPTVSAPTPSFAPMAPIAVGMVDAPRREPLLALPSLPEAAPPAKPAPLPVTPPDFNAAYLDNPPPQYPAIAKRAGEQGKVVLRVLVAASGRADTVEVRTSSGSPRLDDAALETVRRWRFVPARQGDQAIAAWVLVPISFTLQL